MINDTKERGPIQRLIGKIRRPITYHRQLQMWALLFVLPSITILAIFRLGPIIMSARLSLYDYNLLSRREIFVGLDNYATALSDKALWNAIKNTAVFVIAKVPLQAALALGLAMLVNRRWFGVGIVRSAPLMAVVMPMSIAAVLWQMMYHPSNGLINSIIRTFGHAPYGFLTDRHLAMPAIVITTLWKDVGFFMIFYLAGLQGIPREYYDAAEVDGASPWAVFRYVTLPLLRNTTTLVLILSTVFAFQVFIPVHVMTQGGPSGATDVIIYYMYKIAFSFMRMGYANAIAIITLVIVLAIAAFQLRAEPE